MRVITEEGGRSARVEGEQYAWEWSMQDDRFSVRDARGRTIVRGTLQPAVEVSPRDGTGTNRCAGGMPVEHEARDNAVTVRYEGVNGSAQLLITWRFGEEGLWLEPIVYNTGAEEDIVSLTYFARTTGESVSPALHSSHCVVPGLSMSSGVSPVVQAEAELNLTTSLGAVGLRGPGLFQQWGLPAHYFCTFHRNAPLNARGSITEHLSDALCWGLAELPNGNFWLKMKDGRVSPVVNLRSDLWGYVRGPGRLSLGPRLFLTVGPNYYEAIRRYYRGLLNAGIVRSKEKTNSARKTAVALTPQFNTWGAQVARSLVPEQFDEQILDAIYQEFTASGMRAGMFVVDDKWEGKYGTLRHSEERFPHFENFLQRVRDDEYLIGLWAACMRCEDPSELGLTPAHMLKEPDGAPLRLGEHESKYYIFDFTQSEVQKVLKDLAKRFIRRYRPDLVKFDFGYELPLTHLAAPDNMNWAGERLLQKGLEVIIGAMKEENPDLVVMYYGLSPLLIDYYDLHSPDDLFLCTGDYDLEANRRFFFSSLLGELGMPTYGSSGYDWVTARAIWFDSAAVGTPGSLHSFTGDEIDSSPEPEWIAKYNGLAHVLRKSCAFTIEPIEANFHSAARGATSSSWARFEDGQVVLVALRERGVDGKRGVDAYKEIISTDTSVIVASKTSEGIPRSSKLGIVPFGVGELHLRHEGAQASYAEVTEHCLRGNAQKSRINIEDGLLHVPLRERLDDGRCVEWIEVEVQVEKV